MNRRQFVKSSALGAGGIMAGISSLFADESSDLRITRIRHYVDSGYQKPTFAQARDIVVVETNAGITGIGEGGSREMIQQLSELLIGEDPFRIEHLWQKLYRGYFYPSGRERLHAQGGLDMALWDIKAKYLEIPVYNLLGGLTRDYVPLYSTVFPNQGSIKETARACIEQGFYAYRTAGELTTKDKFDPHRWIDYVVGVCQEIKEGVGDEGSWCIDLHTRFDLPEAVTICERIEDLTPVFVEDLVRSENPGIYSTLRQLVKVPIAVGEQFGDRWDINELVEKHLIDHSRVTLPNCGGITEFMKIAALCETHYVGVIPHFTGPISMAALAHVLCAIPGFVMTEMVGNSKIAAEYLNDDYLIFRDGKLYPNNRPGLGVEFLPEKATLVNEITTRSDFKHPMFRRSDGSYTNW